MRNPRRLRLVLPVAVVLGLATFTGIAHAVQQGDPTDASFLSPTSDTGDGARSLADELARAGVTVDVRARSEPALAALGADGEATLFVTTPELVHPAYLRRFAGLPSRVRVVLVAPDPDVLDDARLGVRARGPRWTAAAPEPGCAAGPAGAAGPAAALRWQYEAIRRESVACYDGGLVELRSPGSGELTLVGAADPFRNDRAGEHGNRRLAVGLLSRAPRVVWLDLHEREPAPARSTPAPGSGTPDRTGEPDGSGEDGAPPGGERSGDQQPGDGQPRDAGDDRGAAAGNPLARAFPPGIWAALGLLVLAAVALAVASARRLGAPVAEPLPARVRAAETVRGLGGLYRRAGARGASLRTVQSAARARLIEHFDLPGETGVDDLAARVAAETGQPEDDVRHVLGGGVEDSDEELVRAATAVQELVRLVTGRQNRQHSDEGNLT
ncbi:DUF4350 domain-containing protein [Couchioplanes azureus]|uniref:DUF4350 domain-containing protein n=1 Tax=Couchioplanes caeruleus TaxID=56438 RepID=UPI0016707958|nr:DUF4350 domain-containing protein [Couchioplanes caeruleus]GGQ79401.1 hypothetical protein GCM10010166_56710 [Couchioplanes caeruleus subsp. azureus]